MTKRLVHFIGFDGDGYAAACRVFGRPDFIHKINDFRSHGDIDFDNDIVLIGRRASLTPHPKFNDQDHERH